MGREVLVLTGSPRKGGNSDMLAEAFMNGARAAGHEVAQFNSAADPVKPCRACDACWTRGKACVFDDGFNRLAPLVEKSGVMVLCSPVYWSGFSAQLKAALDKFYAFGMAAAPRPLTGKRLILLMCAANPSMEMFHASERSFADSVKYLGWEDGGRLLVPNVYAKGAIKNTDALVRAEQFGRAL